MAPQKNYVLQTCEVAIFTWHGCRLKITGNCGDAPYKSSETPMIPYLNVNMNLENMRRAAGLELNSSKPRNRNDNIMRALSASEIQKTFPSIIPSTGPRVLVVGPKDSGKSTLCRILASYAARNGRTVSLVDLDPSLNLISLPGTVSAVSIEKPIDIENGLDAMTPMTFWYGWPTPRTNTTLYMKSVNNLANAVKNRWICNKTSRVGGCII
eukprot:UN23807